MTRAPKHAVPTKKGRYYQRDGERFISVTNVIDTCVNKPALVGWAARTVAEEAVDLLARPETALPLLRMARTAPDDAIKLLKGAPYAAKDAAAELGSAVHGLAEAHSLGQQLRDMSDDEQRMVDNYLAFLDDFHPTFEATEATVANRTHGYAGTLDALLRFPTDVPEVGGRLCVVDYKTGKTGPYPEWALQLAAYAHAEHLWLPDGAEIPMPRIDGACVLRIRPDGYALHAMQADDEVFAVFAQAACALARALHDDAESWVGERITPTADTAEVA